MDCRLGHFVLEDELCQAEDPDRDGNHRRVQGNTRPATVRPALPLFGKPPVFSLPTCSSSWRDQEYRLGSEIYSACYGRVSHVNRAESALIGFLVDSPGSRAFPSQLV